MRHSSFKALMIVALVITALFGSRLVAACGFCNEDDRAAVYSDEAARTSHDDPDHYAFVVLKVTHGPLTPDNIKKMHDWMGEQPGITATTVNISQQQRVIGFLFEKKYRLLQLLKNFRTAFPDFTFFKREDETSGDTRHLHKKYRHALWVREKAEMSRVLSS